MADYYKQREINNNKKLKNILIELPLFCFDFFIGIESTTSILTRLNYAYDLRVFFDYLINNIEKFKGVRLKSFSVNMLEQITSTDIEHFLYYVTNYDNGDKNITNHERGKARKLSTIRSFLRYYFNKNEISANVATKITMPKIHDKEIVRLEVDEVVKILNEAESGEHLTDREKAYNKLTRKRDVAILTLFLGTGIRISELVGLNISDFNFSNNSFTVTRKGGNRTILYFSEEVANAIAEYLAEREEEAENLKKELKNAIENDVNKSKKDTDALFLSLQKDRLSIRGVQNIVKKYSKIASPLKNITPHKLRSTYGTTLYKETQDIYIVADVLGHKDVNTTRKHYAAISDDLRRNVANKVKLRDEKEDK